MHKTMTAQHETGAGHTDHSMCTFKSPGDILFSPQFMVGTGRPLVLGGVAYPEAITLASWDPSSSRSSSRNGSLSSSVPSSVIVDMQPGSTVVQGLQWSPAYADRLQHAMGHHQKISLHINSRGDDDFNSATLALHC